MAPKDSLAPRLVTGVSSTETDILENGDTFRVSGEEFHHLFRTLRHNRNKPVEVACFKSRKLYKCQVSELGKREAVLKLIEKQEFPTLSPYKTRLIVGLPKKATADFLVEKLQELGLNELIFFQAERSQIWSGADGRQERWEKISLSALKQSRGLDKLQVHFSKLGLEDQLKSLISNKESPVDLGPEDATKKPLDFILDTTGAPPLLETLYLSNNSKALQGRKSLLETQQQSVDLNLVVGPEGGFSQKELDAANSLGFRSVGLGNNILRVETAAILATGIVLQSVKHD